ncbi:alpha/beta fold hydrolase [Streptomyces sp. KR80]|uniref:alpha/beta fold hydrolase n=1 Tax=Streptomyces sp. KR80 TaxID=3457426 RepID=UPI003FD0959D
MVSSVVSRAGQRRTTSYDAHQNRLATRPELIAAGAPSAEPARTKGLGPTLLFLHGNPTWSFVYREVIRALRHEFRCIALDYPGFASEAVSTGQRQLAAGPTLVGHRNGCAGDAARDPACQCHD